MKTRILGFLVTAIAASACLAQVVPVSPQTVGLIPKTATFDINTNFNNTSTEALGVGIAANGNLMIAWEDDGSGISDTEAIHSMFSGTGSLLTPTATITDYLGNTVVDVTYRAFYRDNGTATPGNVSWGPKVHANLFGNGIGMGGNAMVNDSPFIYGMALEIPRLAGIHNDNNNSGADYGDFPAVQLLNNDGTPAAQALSGVTEADAEPAGSIRIGDWEYLSNGNIVIVGESRQTVDRALTGQTGGNVPVFRIVTPAGVQVKGYTAVSSSSADGQIWHGVGVTANGFAVRFDAGGVQVRMFDNNGNPTTSNINLTTLTGVAHSGRGDGAGFHGNGVDAYLDVTTVNPGTGNTAWITVLNADGSLRYSRAVADENDPSPVTDRVDGAISADGRVIAVFDDNSVSSFRLPEGRLFSKSGAPLGGIFWLSERDDSTNGVAESRRPRAAWRGNNLAIAWESLNSPVTVDRVVAARLYTAPPPPEPRVITVNTANNADFGAGKTNFVWALTNVNDGDTIAFNIPGAGPHYLQTPTDGYPLLIKDNVTINGYSQPGASPNSNPITAANNAQIKIVLDSRNGNYRVMEYTAFTLANSSPPIDNTSMATERGGYGDTEVAILGIYRATNANVRGLAFLGTTYAGSDPSTYMIAVAHDFGLDPTVKDRLAYDAGSSRDCHINGCWFGIDPTNQTPAGVTHTAAAIAFFRHREAGTPVVPAARPELPNESLIVGVKPGSADPRSQFNVMAYMGLTLSGEAIRTHCSGNFIGVMPDGVTPSGVGVFGGGMEIGRYDDTKAMVFGTDGDGVNDGDEGNLFGPLTDGGTVLSLYNTGNKLYVVAGNTFGLAVDGSRWTNSQSIWDEVRIDQGTRVRFGSDFDGTSDALEANKIFNNWPFAALFPDPTTATAPRVFVFNNNTTANSWVSCRGNVFVNNDLVPYGYADSSGGRLVNFTNYEHFILDTTSANGLIPVLAATNVYPILAGTFAPGLAPFTNIVIDVYQLDPEGWANGKLFGFQELVNSDGLTNGFPQGKKYLGSFPVANTGSFSVNIAGLDLGLGQVTVTANYSADPAGTHNGRTHTSNFSNPGSFIPGGAASVGLARIVPDTLVWFSASQAKPKVGGFVVGDDVANGGSVEATAGLLGDSTFLLAASMKADDAASMRFTSVFQPAAGGAPKLGDLFFDDRGVPYTNKINESRQDGNPGRIAGDPRVGAVNIIGAGEVSLWAYPTFFNSDGRFDVAKAFYAYMAAGNARDACVQTFSLNPTTLSQTMLGKAQDSAYGGLSGSTPGAGASADQLSRTGGTVAGLDNGNFVSVVEDRSRLFNPNGNASVATIFAPNGSVVKAAFKVADADQWANVGAFKGGFYVRPSGGLIYFFDNAGNLQGSLNHNDTSGIGFDTGRGDGTRTASDIRSHYVFMAGNAGSPSQTWLAVFDANTRTFVTKAVVSDTDPSLHNLDRVNIAVDALDRACVTFRLKPIVADFSNSQVAARVMKFDGTNITYLTHSFFPFINHDEVPGANNFVTQESSVAMTTRQIFIYAEGTVNSTNNPAGAADTAAQTHLYTVISHPDPQPTPGTEGIVITSITASGPAVTITWTGGTGPYLLQRKLGLNDANWQNVLTTPDKSASVALQGNAAFFRLVDGAQITVTPLTAFLNGGAEQPTANASTATGLGSFSLEGNTLTYYITFSGLSANATAAHIHGPTNTTGAVGVIIPFSPPAATAGVISGSVTVTDQQKTWLLSGLTYANIHNANFPGGEIRGQIGPTQLKATLNGANERPTPVVTGGTGSAALTRIGNRLLFNITYSGLTSAGTAAHIHGRADTSIAAGVLTPLPTPTGTAGTLSGALTLDNPTLAAIVDGLSYVNIHTVNFGGGEIRGQITP